MNREKLFEFINMVNMFEKCKKTTGASHTQSQDVVIFCTQTKKRKRTKMMNTLALFLHRGIMKVIL